ncbi:unnamed protein product [Clonostachys chloroleuca]|uniref:DOMON domain-containing protein n=1 Tax=Clonostachys chloroleuca TaxID=1926264 RepID=A0AA35MEW6_9HYPO|nr:unnamed protein product [Clonostachys chloroleuca]
MKSTFSKATFGLAAALYASLTSADVTSRQVGDSNDIQFQWGVPESSASSSSGAFYVQLSAPVTYQWVGLGIGSRMAGSHILLMYQDGNGNITLSNRQADGHSMPTTTTDGQLELLSGTGVQDGRMVANVRASDLNLQLGGQNSWIAAWKTGSSLDSTNTAAQISRHDGHSQFSINFAQASITSDANPFENSNGTVNNPSSGGNNNGDSSSDGDDSSSSGSNMNTIILAHGIIMAIVFVAMYPIGSMLMPLVGKWYIHGAWQFVAYLMMWAGFGLGYVYAERNGYFFNQAHTRMGTIVVALLGLQPLFGWFHHSQYTKHQSRGIISHVHIWYGRALIIIGIVNGGLGLQLTGNTSGRYMIAYCVVAAVVFAAYIGSIGFGFLKRRRQDGGAEGRRKKSDSPPVSQTREYA